MKPGHDDWKPFASFEGFVRLVLLVRWDPIGVLGATRAMDEYDNYVGPVCTLIRSGATREALIAHLDGIEKRQMGLKGERQAQADVAETLLGVYRAMKQFGPEAR